MGNDDYPEGYLWLSEWRPSTGWGGNQPNRIFIPTTKSEF